jgi:transcriptional regulator with XRE-family HTH domain
MTASGDPLPSAIREAYEGKGLSQVQVARRMGVDQTRISRLALGKWKPENGPDPDVLARIEEACGRPRGWILIAAGYVADVGVLTVEDAINADRALTEPLRQALLGHYRGAVESLKQSLGTRGEARNEGA